MKTARGTSRKKIRSSKRAAASGVPREGYLTLETAALAGAASGIAVGAIGGPPGAIVGGIIGTAVGMMAGTTLDVAQKRADARERELDDAIGVTRGDLGAREQAIAGMKAKDEGLANVEHELTSAPRLLRSEHAHLERVYDALLGAYRDGDWDDVQASWKVFEAELRAHMATEEARVFPAFRAASPEDARQLLAEHDELRRMLETLGVDIELRAVPAGAAEELVRRLRAHGEHEERVLYPWIDATYEPPTQRSLPADRVTEETKS